MVAVEFHPGVVLLEVVSSTHSSSDPPYQCSADGLSGPTMCVVVVVGGGNDITRSCSLIGL